MGDTSTGLYSRSDWARLGRGELTTTEEQEILAEGYEGIIDTNGI